MTEHGEACGAALSIYLFVPDADDAIGARPGLLASAGCELAAVRDRARA